MVRKPQFWRCMIITLQEWCVVDKSLPSKFKYCNGGHTEWCLVSEHFRLSLNFLLNVRTWIFECLTLPSLSLLVPSMAVLLLVLAAHLVAAPSGYPYLATPSGPWFTLGRSLWPALWSPGPSMVSFVVSLPILRVLVVIPWSHYFLFSFSLSFSLLSLTLLPLPPLLCILYTYLYYSTSQ
jgi:hypothetical protein